MTSPTVPPKRRKLPARYAAIMLPLFLTVIMTFFVSGISTWKSLGLTPAFWSMWPTAWVWSWLIAFPVLLVVMPLVRWLVRLIVEAPGTK